YRSTDYEPIPADEQEQAEILHQTYSEQSAAATGLYVKASADFTAQLVYTDSDGSSQSKSIHVQISEDAAPTQMYADTGDDGGSLLLQPRPERPAQGLPHLQLLSCVPP
ncbi:MAG: hypothetical protein KH331_06115, partial [Subdoligranulum variabile]|nr:hypothetical protein [Subdoligranulum variabile]